MKNLTSLALDDLKSNWRHVGDQPILQAGQNQFASLWVRDFCFAVPGLIRAGLTSQAQDVLRTVCQAIQSNGRAPRSLDSMPTQLRVFLNTLPTKVARWMAEVLAKRRFGSNSVIRAEYNGEHGTPALDSQLLLILAIEQLGLQSELKDTCHRLMNHLKPYWCDGAIHQPPFSDWCDSQKREGTTAYMNGLFLLVLGETASLLRTECSWLPSFNTQTDIYFTKFYSKENGVFCDPNGQVSLEINLMLLRSSSYFPNWPTLKIYENLKKTRNWQAPGLPLWPRTAWSEKSWTTKCVGLTGYHDHFRWPWLIAAQIEVAQCFHDDNEAARLTETLNQILSLNGTVPEVISAKKLKQASTWCYRSETHFTWAIGQILQTFGP